MRERAVVLWLYEHVEWLFWPLLVAAVITMLMPFPSGVSSVLLAMASILFSGAMVLQAALGFARLMSLALALLAFTGSLLILFTKTNRSLFVLGALLVLVPLAVEGGRRMKRNVGDRSIRTR